MAADLIEFPGRLPELGADAEPQAPLPVPAVVKRLRYLLRLAEAGEITAIAYACARAPDGVFQGSAGQSGTRLGLIAALNLLQVRLVAAQLDESALADMESC